MRSKSRICRLCMGCKDINREIPDKQIYIKIKECLQVEIDPDDVNLPILICYNCVKCIRKFYAFRKQCWKVQRLLISKLRHRDFIQIVNVANINLPVFEDIVMENERKRPCAFRQVIKKEMMIDIQEVKRPSPMHTARPRNPIDPHRILRENHNIALAASNCRVNETHSFEDKTTEDQLPELIEQNSCTENPQTVNIEPQSIESSGKNLARSEPKRLEAKTDAFNAGCVKHDALEPMGLISEALEPETFEPKDLDPDALNQKALEPEMSNPEAVEPEVVQPEVVDSEVVEPDVVEPEVVEPEFVEPEVVESEAVESEVEEPETFEPEVEEPEAVEPEVEEPEAVEPEVEEPEVVEEPEALDPEFLESGALEPEFLETEASEPEDLEDWESETIEPEYLTPDIEKSTDINTEILDMKSHLRPHDYTTKQASSSVAEKSKSRPRPRRRTTNVSGKALYRSLLMACDTCGKMIERNRMEGHHNKHLGIRPYICPNESCNAAFHCKHARRLHVRCRHGSESFTCDICDKVYRARRDLLGHKREAHSEPRFECDICSKKFTTKSRLKQHRFYHTGERNYPCGLCTMTFFNNFQLKVHMRIHTQARPFVCKVCKKAFRYRHMAKDHIVRQHGIDESLEKDWLIHNPEPEVSEVLKMIKSNM